MKVFETVLKQYALIGINRYEKDQPSQGSVFNKRILCGYFLLGNAMNSGFLYMIYEASDFLEYVECSLYTLGSYVPITCLSTVVFNKATLFECFDEIEKLIDASKEIFIFMICNFAKKIIEFQMQINIFYN